METLQVHSQRTLASLALLCHGYPHISQIERSQCLCLESTPIRPTFRYGVPQGSVLCPALFSDYSSPVASLIRSFNIIAHCYADDTQLYVPFTPGIDEEEVWNKLEDCIDALRMWMNKNRLKLNDKKTEFIIFGTSTGLKKVATTTIRVGQEAISACDKVRNIGAMFDSEMKMDTQVNTMCKSAWFHLYTIGKIRSYLSDDQTKSVVHAYVTPKLDGNNALLVGPRRDYLIDKLQLVQNAAAKIITKSKKFDLVTPLLRQLHWLPISKRITFKVLLLVYKSLNDMGPIYLRDLLIYYKPKREGLRHDPLSLEVPGTELVTYGDRTFRIVAAKAWNQLSKNIRTAKTVDRFKADLKTHLFVL